ncbi:MFS transporter [Streptacidiphilus sp. PB12-B1b]|uniref:MFS transporter n=1 Tax=Streptacidiphilus sp. PB12-B1b TaxID=2705012 RepID=UPI0015FB15B7|nr:MFS transporter [Streptacidiphilus sp. PB12-B1b]QMU78379.1 MFS transporter [Streptacidiphilus sp. PB12-B1b]
MISTRPPRRLPQGYRPLFAHRPFRRLLPALAISDLGDGMSMVAVAWLAVQISPPGAHGPLIGAAVAAYILPGTVGALLLGRWLRPLPAQRLIRANAWTRALFLGCVPLAWALGVLHPALYLTLLAGSSLLYAWGGSAKYALAAQALPTEQHLAANALLSTSAWVSTIVGPALAGVLAAAISPAWIIGLDALSFAALALQNVRLGEPDTPVPAGPAPDTRPGEGLRLLRARPELLGLLAVTWLFNLFYGPVEVALPLFVAQDLHAGAGALGLYWAAFGIGAVTGALAVGTLRNLPLWSVLLCIIAGHGLALLPFALHAPAVFSLGGFALAGVIYGPYSALTFNLFQDRTPAALLTTVLAVRASVLLTASPVGAALGGPLTTALGARQVLTGTGIAMIIVAACAAALRIRSTKRHQIRTHALPVSDPRS